MPSGYLVQALNLYDSINIKGMRAVLTGKVVDATAQEIHFQYGENSYLSVYRFGCLVFFNMTNEEIERETQRVKAALGPGFSFPTSETYQVNVGEATPMRVEFEFVELKKLSIDNLRVISQSVAQSAALEYFEIRVERMLYETSSFMERLAKGGSVPLFPKRLLRIIGSTASTRQTIISNVAVLDPPDGAWKSKELEKLHNELQSNFDIEVRFRTLDRKLALIQDNIEVLADLTTSRRANLLEVAIVLLILFEILMKVFSPGH